MLFASWHIFLPQENIIMRYVFQVTRKSSEETIKNMYHLIEDPHGVFLNLGALYTVR